MASPSPAVLREQRITTYATTQGSLLVVKARANYSKAAPPEKRGVVKGFSRASRCRMLQEIATIDWRHYGTCVLITLTYPDQYYDRTPKERTVDRSRFLRDLENHLGKSVSVLWRLEYKPRKSGEHVGRLIPHFHLIVLGVRYVEKGFVRKGWRNVLGYVGKLVTDVRAKPRPQATAQYTAKYVAKEDSLGALDNVSYLNSWGRAWGLTRAEWVRHCPRVGVADLNEDQLARAMEIAGWLLGRKYVGSYYLLRPDVGALFARIAGKDARLLDLGGGG